MKREELQVRRHGVLIEPNKSRVIIKPFMPVSTLSPGYAARMKRLLKRIMELTEKEAAIILDDVFVEFRNRHRDLEGVFGLQYEQIKNLLPRRYQPSETKRLLIGSYFTCEYSLEAAALFNPSIVPHYDQSGVKSGAVRFIISLRATGEGHISSIEFRTGIINEAGEISVDATDKFVTTPTLNPNPIFESSEFLGKLKDEHCLNSSTKEIMGSFGATFTRSHLLARIARFKKRHKKLSAVQHRSVDLLESLVELNYETGFLEQIPLSERAIYPISSFEINGIEDARFVRFVDDNGGVTYYATYTAYSGISFMPLFLETVDFSRFRVSSLSGEAAKNKGMALFPRKVNGRYAMISRQDGENLFIAFSDNVHQWKDPAALMRPTYHWEFTQIGNCGSPIETEKGWLLLTHGVGPVRKYCIGAVLLDLHNPAKVIGRLKEPLIAPDESEREGYVPNVVYTCGVIKHNGRLIMPYAMSDHATRFASVSVDELLENMQ